MGSGGSPRRARRPGAEGKESTLRWNRLLRVELRGSEVEQLGVLCYRVHLQCRSSDIMCRHHVRHMIMSRSEVADPNVHGVLNERESLPICYPVFPVPAPRDALWT